jgi:hypothetical protein
LSLCRAVAFEHARIKLTAWALYSVPEQFVRYSLRSRRRGPCIAYQSSLYAIVCGADGVGRV